MPLFPELKRREVKWYGWKRGLPDARDHRHVTQPVTVPARGGIPALCVPKIRNQGGQGSCTGHGTRSIHQYVLKYTGQYGGQDHELSPRWNYWLGRTIERTTDQDSGCVIRDVMYGISKYGLASEADCPYNPRDFRTPPTRKALRNATQDIPLDYSKIEQSMNGVRGALNDKFAIVFGFTVYENFESAEMKQTGMMPMPSGRDVGGHCIWCGWYDDEIAIGDQKGGVLCGNSWGTEWGCSGPETNGERGYFWMPYTYLLNRDLCADFWITKTIS